MCSLVVVVVRVCCLQGDKTNSGDTPEKTIENALWAFKQEIKHKTENVSSE